MSMRDIGLDTLLDTNDTGLTAYSDAISTRQPCNLQFCGSFIDVPFDYRDPSSVHELVVEQICDEEDPLDLGIAVG